MLAANTDKRDNYWTGIYHWNNTLYAKTFAKSAAAYHCHLMKYNSYNWWDENLWGKTTGERDRSHRYSWMVPWLLLSYSGDFLRQIDWAWWRGGWWKLSTLYPRHHEQKSKTYCTLILVWFFYIVSFSPHLFCACSFITVKALLIVQVPWEGEGEWGGDGVKQLAEHGNVGNVKAFFV